MTNRKIFTTLLGVLIIIGAIFAMRAIIGSKKAPPINSEKVIKTVFVDTVQNNTVNINIKTNGRLVAKRRLELYAEVQGVFRGGNKLFKPGQEYRTGETLIKIDAAEYFAGVQSAKSNLYNLITAVMPDLRLDYPEIYEKWQNYLQGFDLEKSTPKLPEMETDKERFFISGRGILTSYYNVKNMEQRLAKYSIRAPYSGVLTSALVTEGTLVRSGQKLGEFIDTGVYELEVAVAKGFADLLKVGNNVNLTSLEQGNEYVGKVVRVNGSVDALSQTITAFIEVKNEDLKEGMYLEANLSAKDEPNAIEIPRSLLIDNKEIFVVRDSILDLVPVHPVHFSDQSVVVKDIPNGTIMVNRPIVGGYAGMLVKVYGEKESKTTKQ